MGLIHFTTIKDLLRFCSLSHIEIWCSNAGKCGSWNWQAILAIMQSTSQSTEFKSNMVPRHWCCPMKRESSRCSAKTNRSSLWSFAHSWLTLRIYGCWWLVILQTGTLLPQSPSLARLDPVGFGSCRLPDLNIAIGTKSPSLASYGCP